MSTIHKRRGEHSMFWNHVTYVDNETMEADVSTSMTKRMRTEQMREDALETEEMTMEEQDDDMSEYAADVGPHAENMMRVEPIRVRRPALDQWPTVQQEQNVEETGSSSGGFPRY
eukprot:8976964-Heterocapsa_arctica.AAC.1